MKVWRLNEAFRVVRQFADKTTGILFEATDELLTLYSSSFEAVASMTIPISDGSGEKFVLASDLLSKVIAVMSGGIELAADGNRAVFKSAGVKERKAVFALATLGVGPEVFRKPEDIEATSIATVSSRTLSVSLKSVVFAASGDNSRPTLCGVLFEGDGNHLNFVATDGYRLAKKQVAQTSWEGRAIVDASLLKKVPSIFDGPDVSISIGSGMILFSTKNTSVGLALTMGEFPSYSSVLDPLEKEAATAVSVDNVALVEALNGASVIDQMVVLTFRDGSMVITADSQDGRYEEEVEAEIDGPGLEMVAFNAKHLLEPTKVFGGRVTMRFKSSVEPALVTFAGEEYRYVVMPVRQTP